MNIKLILGIATLSCLSLTNVAQAQEIDAQSPIPGSVETKSEVLLKSPDTQTELAQRDIDLGRLTRHDYSYAGAGAHIGFNGSDNGPIGDIGFSVNGKVAITPNLSFRPNVIFSSNTAFLLPVTYDFTLTKSDPFDPSPFVPYAGGGVAITTQDENSFGVLLTGGVDYRISERFVANAALNLGLMSETTDVGLTLSIGYILSGK